MDAKDGLKVEMDEGGRIIAATDTRNGVRIAVRDRLDIDLNQCIYLLGNETWSTLRDSGSTVQIDEIGYEVGANRILRLRISADEGGWINKNLTAWTITEGLAEGKITRMRPK